MQMAIIHRPLFQGTRPEETVLQAKTREVDLDHESIFPIISVGRILLDGRVSHALVRKKF
jgi:hypothetical protein